MKTSTHLAIHILNRVWSRCLQNNYDFDAMHVVEALQMEIINDSVEPIDTAVIELLGHINLWANQHEVEVKA